MAAMRPPARCPSSLKWMAPTRYHLTERHPVKISSGDVLEQVENTKVTPLKKSHDLLLRFQFYEELNLREERVPETTQVKLGCFCFASILGSFCGYEWTIRASRDEMQIYETI